jgi:hypothetical protein
MFAKFEITCLTSILQLSTLLVTLWSVSRFAQQHHSPKSLQDSFSLMMSIALPSPLRQHTSEAPSETIPSSCGVPLLSGRYAALSSTLYTPNVLQVCQLMNLSAHWTLNNLRPAGTKLRKIPYGPGFGLVSFPNYFFETLGWTVVTAMTGSYAGMTDAFISLPLDDISISVAALFLVVSTVQMMIWAAKKHRGYKKEFKDYPKGRKAMFPFVF